MKVVLYTQDNGSVALVVPTGELSVEDVALKDVPEGTPFVIIGRAELPDDIDFMAAWVVDFSNPDGVGMGDAKWREWRTKL